MVARKGMKKGATRGRPNENLAAQIQAVNEQENVPIPIRSTKLLITNLDNEVTDSDICELFSEFGSIREVAAHYNCWGYSLGTAHVVYLQPEDAAEAARSYNGVPLDGRPMTITVEGSPNGSYAGVADPLPVKMRLSFGPDVIRNPLSQLNRGSKVSKAPKRLGSGPQPFNLKNNGPVSGLGVARGRGIPRGRPAGVRGRPVGRLPTAAELDLELEEYLHQTRKNTNRVASAAELDLELEEYLRQTRRNTNGVASANGYRTVGLSRYNEVSTDDYGEVNEVLQETPNDEVMEITKTPKNTPGSAGKRKKTPKRTPGKTPSTTPGKTPKRTPGKTPSTTPGKTPSTTPGKTPKKTPGKTPSVTPGETPSVTSGNTPARVTGRTPAKTSGKTPGKSAKQTKTPNTITDETHVMEVTGGDLEKTNPPSAVPKAVKKKLNVRRSGRFSKME